MLRPLSLISTGLVGSFKLCLHVTGKVVPARNAVPYLRQGYSAAALWGICGPGGKILHMETEGVRALVDQRMVGNYTMWPALNTWR